MSILVAGAAAALMLADTSHLVLALAGSGAGEAMLAGLLGPLLGLDHLLTPVWLGLWAGRLGGREVWRFPASFLLGLVLGFAMGLGQPAMPDVAAAVHLLSLASLMLVVGAALPPLRLPAREAVSAIALMGGCNGYVHGTDVTEVQTLWFGLGATASVALLLALGLAGGWALQKGS